MMIAKNDEVKRNHIWRLVIGITTVLIIVIAVFFLTRMFTGDPVEGTWENEDMNMKLEINDGIAQVTCKSLLEETNVKIRLNYTLDKEEKIITMQVDTEELEKVAKDSKGKLSAENLQAAVSPLLTTFNYNIENGELTLTEREYGEELVFTRK